MKKKLLYTLFVLCALLSLLPATVFAATVGDTFAISTTVPTTNGDHTSDWPYIILSLPEGDAPGTVQLGDGENNLISGWGTGTLTIPETVENEGEIYQVTAIGDKAFYSQSKLTGLVLPPTVSVIGRSAFYNCEKLSGTLTLGDSVTDIGERAFGSCGFSGLSIGKNAANIGAGAFGDCTNMRSMTIASENPNFLAEDNIVYNKDKTTLWFALTTISGTLTIPESVTVIGDSAFTYCQNLTGLQPLPQELRSIGASAFSNCRRLTGPLVIPDSVQSIGAYAFYMCGFTSLTLGENLETIGDNAFIYCQKLTGDLMIPDKVTSIGASAFNGCNALDGSLVLGRSVATIGDNAFMSCSNLTGTVALPSTVSTVSQTAFAGCTKLTGISVDSQNPSFSAADGILYNKDKTRLYFGISGLSGDIAIPETVTVIGDHAFERNNAITGNLIIPDSVTAIGESAFNLCTGLNGSLTLSKNLETIGSSAFWGCSSLTGNLTIPAGVTTIPNSVFYGCSSLTGDLILPLGVTAIGGDAFLGCSRLERVILPASLTTLDSGAFMSCSALTSVTFEGATAPTLGQSLFNSITPTIYIPAGSTGYLDDPYHQFDDAILKAFLSSLATNQGVLAPAFRPTIASYTLAVPSNAAAINITPEGTGNLSITLNGITAAVGNGATVSLPTADTTITIVTALTEDPSVTETYTIAVTKTLPPVGDDASDGSGSSGPTYTATPIDKPANSDEITTSTLNNLVAKDRDLTIKGTHGATLIFDPAALREISSQATDSVRILIEDVSKTHPGKQVYSLEVMSGTKTISDFGAGTVIVSLPYTLKDGEMAEDVRVWRLAANGDLIEIPCSYDAARSLATVKLSHFSLYVVGVAEKQWQNPFTDVDSSHWFYTAVQKACEQKLMQGTSATAFAPNASTTRGMTVTMLYNMAGQPEIETTDTAWFAKGKAWAMAAEVSDGSNMEDSITREQLLSMLWRAAGKPETTGSTSLAAFDDSSSISDYAYSAFAWAYEQGIVSGKGNHILDPKGTATRAEAASIFTLYLDTLAR